MRDFRDAKTMATTLRDELAARDVQLSRADCLELISKALGEADWNTLSARIKAQTSGHDVEADTNPSNETWGELVAPFYDRHLTAEERIGPWGRLFSEARALHGAETDANSDEVLDLARRWMALSRVMNGGNTELSAKYAAAYRDALDDPQVARKLPLSRDLLRWLAPALAQAKSELGES